MTRRLSDGSVWRLTRATLKPSLSLRLYATGIGVARDDAEATKWFMKAAENGNAAAQYNMGVRYAYGRGIPKDNKEAAFWFRKSGEQGFAPGQLGIAAVN